ncbi:hypothetical protein [Candidatus Tisiphia endosymbiont of Nemotelus uliginosus]|uniref:hypothetical protein n=1 Tax=Candidatus Tisiphia endosymbiont of Nemotelus uliginosus TaxID=3077926 RepID=UPI0035CAE24A
MHLSWDLDTIIFVTFLIFTLAVGLFFSRGIKNINEYAIGNRNFSTSTITATIIATCIGGGFFSGAVSESYKQGLYFIIPAIGEPLALIIVGYLLAPRMAEFFSRIEGQEQQQLHSLQLQLKALYTKLQKTANKDQISRITEDLCEVAKRIEAGVLYLSTITHRVRRQVHIKLTKVNIMDLVNEVVVECEKLSEQPLRFVSQYKIKYPNIICDPEKLKEVIKSLLIHAINNNVDSNLVGIFLEDDILDFELNISKTTKSKKPIEAIRLTIKNQGDHLTEQQLKLIFTPTFRQTNELTFFECSNIIDAHYGNFKVDNNQDKGINYNITIPANIKEIRPKVMDLPDIRIENFEKITEIFLQEQKDDRLNIAQKLLKAGVDFDIIEQATLIKKEEITNIKVI